MRFSELAGKELVDVREGIRLGELGDADLVFDTRNGRVRAVVVAPRTPWWRRSRELIIPWRAVRKIGIDLIVVDLGAAGGDPLAEPPEGDEEAADPIPDPVHTSPIPTNGASSWEGGGRSGGSTFFFRRR